MYLLISSLPGMVLITLVESRGLSSLVNSVSKDEYLVFYLHVSVYKLIPLQTSEYD